MGPNQYWLDNGVKIFSLQFNFHRPSIYDLKTDESDPSFPLNLKRLFNIEHKLNSYNTQNQKIISSQITNTHLRIQ